MKTMNATTLNQASRYRLARGARSLAMTFVLCALFGGVSRVNAQVLVTVDPNQPWVGYMNVFSLPANGGGFLFGFVDGTSALQATFGTTNLTLSPCTNVWGQSGYVTGGTPPQPAVIMDANCYVQDDTLANTNVVFVGSCASNTLTANPEPQTGVYYTSVAFIKAFDAGYAVISSVTSNLVAGQSFSINLDTTGAAHVQYGFETMGPPADPATASALGNVVVNLSTPSAVVTVDPSQGWVGYMSVSALPANGGGYGFGNAWGTSDLQAAFSGTTNLTLSPCTNVWNPTDSYWVQPDGVTPNEIMDASMYVQNDNLANTNLIFVGTCLSNTLTANPEPHTGISYTSVAFIKIFDGSYNLIGSAASSQLAAGQPFAISLNTSGAAHVQYGFETVGPDADPATAASLGNVVLAAAIPASPAPTLTNAPPTPTRPQSAVLSMYNSSGVYTNVPVERWLSSWSGSAFAMYPIPGTGRTVLKYSSMQYAGVEFYNNDATLGAGGDNVGGTTNFAINTTGYDHIHVDVWTPNSDMFGIQLVSLNPTAAAEVDYFPASGTITNYGWISLDIPLSTFAAANPNTVLTNLQQLLWVDNQTVSGTNAGFTGGTFYIDNVYFYNSAALVPPTIAASLSGDSLQLSFPTQTGHTYTVQYKVNLTDAVWQTLSSVSGNNAVQIVADPATQSRRFYRLAIQ